MSTPIGRADQINTQTSLSSYSVTDNGSLEKIGLIHSLGRSIADAYRSLSDSGKMAIASRNATVAKSMMQLVSAAAGSDTRLGNINDRQKSIYNSAVEVRLNTLRNKIDASGFDIDKGLAMKDHLDKVMDRINDNSNLAEGLELLQQLETTMLTPATANDLNRAKNDLLQKITDAPNIPDAVRQKALHSATILLESMTFDNTTTQFDIQRINTLDTFLFTNKQEAASPAANHNLKNMLENKFTENINKYGEQWNLALFWQNMAQVGTYKIDGQSFETFGQDALTRAKQTHPSDYIDQMDMFYNNCFENFLGENAEKCKSFFMYAASPLGIRDFIEKDIHNAMGMPSQADMLAAQISYEIANSEIAFTKDNDNLYLQVTGHIDFKREPFEEKLDFMESKFDIKLTFHNQQIPTVEFSTPEFTADIALTHAFNDMYAETVD